MPQPGNGDERDGNIPVDWLNRDVTPTRWARMAGRLNDLPAALCLLVTAVLVIVFVHASAPSFARPDKQGVPAAEVSMLPANNDTGSVAATGEATQSPANAPATPPPGPTDPPQPTATTAPTQPPLTPTPVPTEAAITTPESPGELGRVPIIMYHAFVSDPAKVDPWTLSFDQFRSHLDWLREHDFVMVGAESMINGRFDVPAGKRPVILTFDDASPSQFGLQLAGDGSYEVRPDTAVGVLEAYAQEYPEFTGPALFAILPFNCFESDDDPSTCEERLNWLVDHGYEVGNHTSTHNDLTDVDSQFFKKTIGEMVQWLDQRVPAGPRNLSHVLVLPYGAYPDEQLHPDQREAMANGFMFNGEEINLSLIMEVSGGPAYSPYNTAFFPVDTYRINSEPDIFDYFRNQVETSTVPLFISDGDPDVVSIPASLSDAINTDFIERNGLELRIYDDGDGGS